MSTRTQKHTQQLSHTHTLICLPGFQSSNNRIRFWFTCCDEQIAASYFSIIPFWPFNSAGQKPSMLTCVFLLSLRCVIGIGRCWKLLGRFRMSNDASSPSGCVSRGQDSYLIRRFLWLDGTKAMKSIFSGSRVRPAIVNGPLCDTRESHVCVVKRTDVCVSA